MPTQRVPQDGVYVTYWWDMGNNFNAVHYHLTSAIAAASDLCKVGFARWDSDEIEDIQPDPSHRGP